MIIKRFFQILLFTVLFSGCEAEDVLKTADKNKISFSPIVCSYTDSPTYGTPTDLINLNVKVMDNNTVEVYFSDYSDFSGSEKVTLDYIYGETFEITEEQKQNIITEIKENKINELENCGDDQSCDGSYRYIDLYDAAGNSVHSCGGLNPHNDGFEDTAESILTALPENTIKDIRIKSEEVIENMSEN